MAAPEVQADREANAVPAGRPEPGRLVTIEAARGLAALSVATIHALGAATAVDGAAWPGLLDLPWLAGVDVFFVVSGFVLVHASRGWFGQPGARRRFLAHRAARVVPLYWVVTTAFVLAALLRPAAFTDRPEGWASVVASYAFVPWPRADGSMLPVFRLGWTLQYEALFYAVFALWLGARAAVAVPGVALSLLSLMALRAWPAAPAAVAFWSDPILLEFGFGMTLAVLFGAGVRLPRLLGPVLLVGGLALLLAVPGIPLGWPRPVLYGLPAAMLIGLVLLEPRPATPGPARTGPLAATRLRALAWHLGAISYALYLTHLFAVRALREAARLVPFGPLFVPLALAASVALAVAVHRWVERPAVAAARRWLA